MIIGDKVSFVDEDNHRTMRGYVTGIFGDGTCTVADDPRFAEKGFYDIQWAQCIRQDIVKAGWPTRSPGGWEK